MVTHNLGSERRFHSSWETSNGIYLFGGHDSSTRDNAVLVKSNGEVEYAFDLKYSLE